jgi:FdhE protein
MPLRAGDGRWGARITRARALAGTRPEARAALEFFAELTAFQQSLLTRHIDAQSAWPAHLRWLERNAPEPVAVDASRMVNASTPWPELREDYAAATALDSPAIFAVEALLHVFPPSPCPHDGPPVVSLLREAGHGARRWYVCGVCLAETPAPRLGCVACGEASVDRLPNYRSEATEPARIDACDTCHGYVKTIDFTRDGAACPIADDIASVSLDLWAREHGYHRVRPNLLRL